MWAPVQNAVRFFTLFVAASLSLSLAAYAQLGVAGGYGLNVISQPDYSGPGNNFKSTGGFNLALFYNFPIGQIDIRPSASFQKNTFDWELDEVEIFNPLEGDFRVAELALDLHYRFARAGNAPYVLFGPEVNFVAANRAELRTVLQYEGGSTKYYGINIGAGYRFVFADLGLALEPEIRYSQALGGFMNEDFIVRTVSYDGDSARSLSNLTIRLNLSFAGFD